MLGVRDFVLINNADLCGLFYLHYGYSHDYPHKGCLRPAFKIEKKGKGDFNLIPGYMTTDEEFYPCPVSACYVQINALKNLEIQGETFIDAEIMVFSKDYKQNRGIKINLESPLRMHNPLGIDIMYLNNIVNALNKYIDAGNELHELDETIYKGTVDLLGSEKEELINIINNLNFKFYSNDFNRVGKDNYFWNEIEISRLPKSQYLKELLAVTLSKSKITGNVNYNSDNDYLFVKYDQYSAYSKAFGKKEIEKDEKIELHCKDICKLYINEFYSKDLEINEILKGKDVSQRVKKINFEK